jgi:putative permease
MRRLFLFVMLVCAILFGLVLAWRLADIVLMFVASLVVAAALRAPIDWLTTRGTPRALAMLLVYGAVSAGAAGLVIFLFGALDRELVSLSEDLSFIYAHLRTQFGVLAQVVPSTSGRLPTPEQMMALITRVRVGELELSLLGAGQTLATRLGNLALVFVLSIYWTADRLRFERLALSLLPVHGRATARKIWRAIETGLGRYCRSELLQSLLAGALLAPFFMLLGLRWPVFWALAASLAWLVPMVGGILVIVPMALVVWVQSGPLTAALAVGGTLAVLTVLEFVVERRLYKRERGINVLTIMGALVMADAFGLVGLLLAPMLAFALHILLKELAGPQAARASRPALAADVSELQARLAEARGLMASEVDEKDARLENLADRLDSLLAEARSMEV